MSYMKEREREREVSSVHLMKKRATLESKEDAKSKKMKIERDDSFWKWWSAHLQWLQKRETILWKQLIRGEEKKKMKQAKYYSCSLMESAPVINWPASGSGMKVRWKRTESSSFKLGATFLSTWSSSHGRKHHPLLVMNPDPDPLIKTLHFHFSPSESLPVVHDMVPWCPECTLFEMIGRRFERRIIMFQHVSRDNSLAVCRRSDWKKAKTKVPSIS